MEWVYFATDSKASLSSTLGTILNQHVLWREASNNKGATIANVGNVRVGDRILVAWRKTGLAYLACTVAAPIRPLRPNLVIDVISGQSGSVLVDAGYPTTGNGDVEVIRLDAIEECYFALVGRYGGNNAIHKLDEGDAAASAQGTSLPWSALTQLGHDDARPQKDDTRRGPEHFFARLPSTAHATQALSIDAEARERCFDAYVMVDWSSSSKLTTGNDSIWLADGAWTDTSFQAGEPRNLSTRRRAQQAILETVRAFVDRGKRVLIGMDFAFGYPAGFASALGLPLTGGAWRALHEHFGQQVTDSPSNAHNRDEFADACNRRVAPNGPGPFWGCTRSSTTPTLTQHRQGVFTFPYAGVLDEWRITDRRAAKIVTTQSVWKINCGVSVGGQTILGIKYLNDLARELDAKRWPFDTGWSVPSPRGASVWFAEIFPSLVRYPEWEEEYRSQRDRTQVQSCVRRAAERDANGTLGITFAQPAGLSASELAQVVGEEGWMLFL